MTEDYLHYIWKYKLFSQSNLKTTKGEDIEIKDFGFHNHDSGPDFSQAKIRIGDTIWAGNVEIHVNSSDWLRHSHQSDKAYDSVVLHVVYNYDKEIKSTKGSIIPTLELKNKIDYSQFEEYQEFIFSSIPCSNMIKEVPSIIISSTVEQMLIERLSTKSEIIKEELEKTNYDWEQVFFQFLAKSIGMKINSQPMEQLAKNTPVILFSKLGTNLKAIESILFGQAGFLDDDETDVTYFRELKKEYTFHQHKNNLIPINRVFWKMSKLRPPNFPTVRLAQLAKLLIQDSQLFNSLVVQFPSYSTLRKIMSITLNEGFWLTHYTFDKESKSTKKSIGNTLINSIIINTITPFLYSYGKYKDDETYIERAISLLQELPPENNKITRIFEDKIELENSADTQGIIHCHNEYCVTKRCLECSIGIHLLKKIKL